MLDLWPENSIPPSISMVALYVIGGVGLVVPILLAIRRALAYRRLASQAQRALDPDAELREGRAIVVGVVEQARDEKEIVTVEIEQNGTEKENSGTYSHRWTENRRSVRVAPFYLRLASGERIRAHPTEGVKLIDDLDGVVLVKTTRRVRIAQLVPGEEVIAEGQLRRDFDPEGQAGAYREGPTGWVLEAPARGPLTLSSEPLAHRFQRWQRFHTLWAIGLGFAFVLLHALHFDDHARVLDGSTIPATVTKAWTYVTTNSDGDETTHYAVESMLEDGSFHRQSVMTSDWHQAKVGAKVAIRRAGVRSFLRYGKRATIGFFALIAMLGVFIASWVGYFVATRRAQPWYANALIDRGSGQLNGQTGLLPTQGLKLSDVDDGR